MVMFRGIFGEVKPRDDEYNYKCGNIQNAEQNNLRVSPGPKYNWDLKSHVVGGNFTGKKTEFVKYKFKFVT